MGIDLGTSSTLIYLAGKGILLNEPSVVAMETTTGKIIAMGKEAQRMLGRTSQWITVFCPMRNGVISDYGYTHYMMQEYIHRVSNNAVFNPRVVLCIPGEITDVERHAAIDAVRQAGARKICLLDESMAAALGAGLDITASTGCGVIDIGGGTADMAVISLGGIAASRTCKFAGNAFDEALINFLRAETGILIGDRMAQEAKHRIGCVRMPEEEKAFTVRGRNLRTGLPNSYEVTSSQMVKAYQPVMDRLAGELKTLLEETAPELVSDLYEPGIALTGGGALLDGIDEVLSERARIRVHRAEHPLECVALGAGKALKFLDWTETPGCVYINPLTEA